MYTKAIFRGSSASAANSELKTLHTSSCIMYQYFAHSGSRILLYLSTSAFNYVNQHLTMLKASFLQHETFQ